MSQRACEEPENNRGKPDSQIVAREQLSSQRIREEPDGTIHKPIVQS